jgi:arylsulfatase A-like enzyme
LRKKRNVPYYRPAIVYAAVLAIGVAAIVALESRMRPAAPPSVVLITVDSLRADHLGLYGYSRDTSPNIDAFAERSVVFDAAFTVDTLSGPSHASIMTSLYPVTHGVIYNGYELDAGAQTLTEMLRSAGYQARGVVGDWIVGREMGFAQGFDRFEQMRAESSTRKRRRALSFEARAYRLALNWLRTLRGQRYFIWLHCQHPHFSYDPPPPYHRQFDDEMPTDFPYKNFETMRDAHRAGRLTAEDRARVVALYDGEIAFTDAMLGPLFDELRQEHPQTLVLLTADHGDLFFEPAGNPQVGHGGGNFYDGAMRVPLIVSPPAGFGSHASRVETPVSTVDLLPTIAELTGIELPETAEGHSLVPLIADGQEPQGRAPAYAMYLKDEDRRVLALRTERYKLIHREGAQRVNELYDLVEDPQELRNLSDERPDLSRSMTEDLLLWFDERPGRLPGARQELSREIEELLRAGGYLDEDGR